MDENAKKYYAKVHFWGILTLGLAMVVCLSMGVYLSYVCGYHPGWDKIMTAFLGVAAMVGHTWVNVADQITYILLMGPAATYMSCLTGNVKNMRLPSAMAAAAAADAAEGTPKRDVLATVGVFASVVVNTLFLVVLVFGGALVLELLPEPVMEALGYIVPALFGAIFAQFALMSPRAALVCAPVVVLVIFLPLPSFLKTFLAIAAACLLNVLLRNLSRS